MKVTSARQGVHASASSAALRARLGHPPQRGPFPPPFFDTVHDLLLISFTPTSAETMSYPMVELASSVW
jgi:hypothetical protein